MRLPGPRQGVEAARSASEAAYYTLVDVFITGVAVVVPLVITVYILDAAYGFLVSALQPFVEVIEFVAPGLGAEDIPVVGEWFAAFVTLPGLAIVRQLVSLAVLLAFIGVVGVVARNRYGEHLIEFFDAALMSLPGIGSIYKSFRRMSDVMMESDVSNFRDVVLVEFPTEEIYVIGFVTNDTPPTVEEATGNEDEGMQTIFLPFAPNPFMGGLLTNIPGERITDVDMTIEEGVRTIVTTGIATSGSGEGSVAPDVSVEDIPGVESFEELVEHEREKVHDWEDHHLHNDDDE